MTLDSHCGDDCRTYLVWDWVDILSHNLMMFLTLDWVSWYCKNPPWLDPIIVTL